MSFSNPHVDGDNSSPAVSGERKEKEDLLSGNLVKMIQNVEYAEIVTTVGWTDKSLRDIVIQLIIRQSRGGVVLPVGEIGKGLLEKTGNVLIMSEIKERYGGLKRFLESQPGIQVHDDHPFNPSVTLDPSLMMEGLLSRAASFGGSVGSLNAGDSSMLSSLALSGTDAEGGSGAVAPAPRNSSSRRNKRKKRKKGLQQQQQQQQQQQEQQQQQQQQEQEEQEEQEEKEKNEQLEQQQLEQQQLEQQQQAQQHQEETPFKIGAEEFPALS